MIASSIVKNTLINFSIWETLSSRVQLTIFISCGFIILTISPCLVLIPLILFLGTLIKCSADPSCQMPFKECFFNSVLMIKKPWEPNVLVTVRENTIFWTNKGSFFKLALYFRSFMFFTFFKVENQSFFETLTYIYEQVIQHIKINKAFVFFFRN